MQQPAISCAQFAAGTCVSCSEITVPYEQQLQLKSEACAALLQDYFVDPTAPVWLTPHRSEVAAFRNKAKFVVLGAAGKLLLGLQGPRGSVDLTTCPIQDPQLNAAGQQLREFMNGLPLSGYDVARRRGDLKFVHVTVAPSGNLLVRFVVQSMAAAEQIASRAAQLRQVLPEAETVTLNILPEHRAVLEGDTEYVLWGSGLRVRLPQVSLQLLPQSFFQTNTAVAAGLYAQARQWADQLRPRSVLDLYCGVGGFALHLAEPKNQAGHADGSESVGLTGAASTAVRRVVGVELSEYAVRAAKRSAREQGLAASFVAADATAYALQLQEFPELLIVNPPRRGIGRKLCEWIQGSQIHHIIYSSCNPESLAADLAQLPGYRITQARIFDMFAHTKHVECAVLLQRMGEQ